MFNVGKALKVTAWIFGIALAIVAISWGLAEMVNWGFDGYSALILFGGCLLAWLSFIFIFGFGEIVDTAIVNRNGVSSMSRNGQGTIQDNAGSAFGDETIKKSAPKSVKISQQCPICKCSLVIDRNGTEKWCPECGRTF